MKIRWTAPALRDLEAIGDYLERESSAAIAARIVTTILDCVDTLADFPHKGRPGRVPDTRELVVSNTPYVVPYRVRNVAAEILAVFHGARRWPETFD
jgi:toxin ParE1/3/4